MKLNESYDGFVDAFIELKDVDDEAVKSMIPEGRAFSLHNNEDLREASDFLNDNKDEEDVQLEVIDISDDVKDHLVNKDSYIGQAILRCNKCMANRFVDMDKLVPAEGDPNMYNVEDECPNCHSNDAGFELVGQVAKMTPEEEQADEEEVVSDEEAVEIENDEAAGEDEATFDNDEEESSEEDEEEFDFDLNDIEEEPQEVERISDTEEEESDGMETETSETEEDDLELPELGDEYDADDDLKAEDEEEDKEKKESLNEELSSPYAEEAWMMNRVMQAMNNEDAYFSWIYTWPDGETREECEYDFGDADAFEDLKETFLRIYKHYQSDGLFEADDDVVEYAHKTDELLHLRPIDNLRMPGKVREERNHVYDNAAALVESMSNPENIERVVVYDGDGKVIFDGELNDLPVELRTHACKSYNIGDGYLGCNIERGDTDNDVYLRDVLAFFDDDDDRQISLFDIDNGEEVFNGNKKGAIEKFGSCPFLSLDTPRILVLTVDGSDLENVKPVEVTSDAKSELVDKILKANNLSEYRLDRPAATEYWINESIDSGEDLDTIYENFVFNTEDKDLIKEFKSVTGYRDAVDIANEQLYGKKAAEVINETSNVRSFRNRKELAEAIQECESNNRPYKVSRSLTEGYRYDLTEQAEPFNPDDPASDELDIRADEIDSLKDEEIVPADVDEDPSLCPACGQNPCVCELEEYEDEEDDEEIEVIDESDEEDDDEEIEIVDDDEEIEIDDEEEIEQEDPEGAIVPVNGERNVPATEEDVAFITRIQEVANTIATAISDQFDVEADPALIVADILQDLRLISGDIDVRDLEDTPMNRVTKQMFQDYEAGYEFVNRILSALTGRSIETTRPQKLEQALRALNSDAFEEEKIRAGVASPQFLAAVEQGAVPFLNADQVPQLHENLEEEMIGEDDVCPECGHYPCDCEETAECVTEECSDGECEEEPFDFDIDAFDEEANEYFNEAYEDATRYVTLKGRKADDGIVLEGIIRNESSEMPVTFTLTRKLTEDANDRCIYEVRNNVSEESFEYELTEACEKNEECKDGSCEECEKEAEVIEEAHGDLTKGENTVASVLAPKLKELTGIDDAKELKQAVLDLIKNEVPDSQPAKEKALRTISAAKNKSALLSTIGAWALGIKA